MDLWYAFAIFLAISDVYIQVLFEVLLKTRWTNNVFELQ